MIKALEEGGMKWDHVGVEGEPSPELVDEAVGKHGGGNIDVVIGIGGGRALELIDERGGELFTVE